MIRRKSGLRVRVPDYRLSRRDMNLIDLYLSAFDFCKSYENARVQTDSIVSNIFHTLDLSPLSSTWTSLVKLGISAPHSDTSSTIHNLFAAMDLPSPRQLS